MHYVGDDNDYASAELVDAYGTSYRVCVHRTRPIDRRGTLCTELSYSIRDGHAWVGVVDVIDIVDIVNCDGHLDVVGLLTRIAIDMLKPPHPFADVRDAARARKVAEDVLSAIA